MVEVWVRFDRRDSEAIGDDYVNLRGLYDPVFQDAAKAIGPKTFDDMFGWNEHIGSLTATHELDLIAGGYEHEISGMGSRSENYSIGPQWTADSRSGSLDRHAEELERNGCPLIRVDLVAQ